MTILRKGENGPWPGGPATFRSAGLPPGSDIFAFLVAADGKVRADDDFIFFNHPVSACGGVTLSGESVTVDPEKLPADVASVVIAAAHDAHPLTSGGTVSSTLSGLNGAVEATVTGLTLERAAMFIEFYRRGPQWKVRNVSAGWDAGFVALVEHHGVIVDDAPAIEAPTSAQEPALDLFKSGAAAIDLGKRTGQINLVKGQQVSIKKTGAITAACSWPRDTDYDIYALVRYLDGRTETVAQFGTYESQAFATATADGAVRHTGDVGRADGGGVGHESIEIRLTDDIVAVLPVVYSAQSNGAGSFREYKVGMSIDNGQGDRVVIDATDGSDDWAVYTCAPGIIINDSDGVRIQYLEYYSEPGSERRPLLASDLTVVMDQGETNDYK